MVYTLLGALAGAVLGGLAYALGCVLAAQPAGEREFAILRLFCGATGAVVGAIAGAAQSILAAIRRLERNAKKLTPVTPFRDADHG